MQALNQNYDARRRVALTGTPLQVSISEGNMRMHYYMITKMSTEIVGVHIDLSRGTCLLIKAMFRYSGKLLAL